VGASVLPLFYASTQLKAILLMIIGMIAFALITKPEKNNRLLMLWFIAGLFFGMVVIIGVWFVSCGGIYD
jgi:cytochrome bd-type quinol oxidase subunit 1